ncbi:hypothetical protein KNP414_01835 [Paenibacillus mucilaginosus KNP414]|uniref:Uncharacterized protein n=1 Tax=Paenibacillus mucilaginosus (strain KNP414) TaxID=1036673 RepID=F8FQP2_PAEMK|nr:hypothetical protein KNP414_01835 [Paenibacillus mucilaginosus KNP414]
MKSRTAQESYFFRVNNKIIPMTPWKKTNSQTKVQNPNKV